MFLSERREFPSAPCLAGGEELDDSSRLDVVEIAHVPGMLPSMFPSWSGQGLISTPVIMYMHDTNNIKKHLSVLEQLAYIDTGSCKD